VVRSAALVVSLALAGACPRDPSADAGVPRPGQEPVGVVDLEGRPRDPLRADGRVDLLVFVRSDCPISNRYAPKLARVAERFAEAPVDVFLVYVDVDEGPATIREHMAEYRLPGTALRDPGQILTARGQITVTPEVALFDGDGILRYHGRIDDGWIDYGKPRAVPQTDELVDALTAVLAGEAPVLASAEAVGCPLPPLPSVRIDHAETQG
jgi:thiol-disulfide isomerase/thioredoxin